MTTAENATIYTINKVDYFDSFDFAKIVRRSKVTLNVLIKKGNQFRKLKFLRIGATVGGSRCYIPVSELTEFPFALGGQSKKVYYYNSKGERQPAEEFKNNF